MFQATSARASRFRLILLLLPLIAGLGCSRQKEFDTLFRENLSSRALACFHPLGKIRSAGPIKVSGGDSFRGTIYWQGGFSGNDYETRIEAKIGEESATISLVGDTAPIPAADRTCLLPLAVPAVPEHEAAPDPVDDEDQGALPPETTELPDEAPPPP